LSLLWLAAACLAGCTTRAWYDGLQNSARLACQQQPSAEQERCAARVYRDDYDSYRRQTQQLAPSPKNNQ
jgi:hypothetical protein